MKRIFFIIIYLVILLSFSPVDVRAANPVIWKTEYNEFSSSDFYIQIGERYFFGTNNVNVSSDPGVEKTTLELTWKESNIEMRLYLYFEKIENGMWQMYDLRTYNSSGSDWIYYSTTDSLGNPVRSMVGYRDYYYERTFVSKDGSAKIYCKHCSITAFIKKYLPPSASGYNVDFRIGIPQGETITISNDPMTGYGVNAVFLNSSGEIIKDQSDFTYNWKAENENILTVMSQSVPYPDGNCAYGVISPCPNFNAQISGKSPGISRVLLDVIRKSDNLIVASNNFTVKVIDKNQPSPTVILPTQANLTITPMDNSNVNLKLEELQGEVGKLRIAVKKQEEDINIIQRIIKQIQLFLSKIFGRSE